MNNSPTEQLTDRQWVLRLIDDGKVVVDGGQGKLPDLAPPDESIHTYKDLEHRGFGFFRNADYDFDRMDAPSGARYYVRKERK